MKNKILKNLTVAIGIASLAAAAPASALAEDTTESVTEAVENAATEDAEESVTEAAENETEADTEALSEGESEEEIQCIGEHKTIDVNGTTLYYEVAGEGKPVVLVHGNGGNHKVFYKEIQHLVDAGYQVYAPDSRGQGENAPQEEYHYEEFAEDMYQFITALGLDKPAYYGWSDGGIIGLLLEISHPDTVSLMAISGTNLYPDGAQQEILDMIQEDYDKTGAPLEKLMLTEPNIDPEELKAITVPVLVLAGSEDVIKQEHTELIADSLPNSELHIVEGEDHGSYIQGSEIAGELILKFLQEHDY